MAVFAWACHHCLPRLAGAYGKAVAFFHRSVEGEVCDKGQGNELVQIAGRDAQGDRLYDVQPPGDVAAQSRDLGFLGGGQVAGDFDND